MTNTSKWHAHNTVAAVCHHDGAYLMVKERDPFTGDVVINQPAGHVEANESIVDAVVRETLEETQRHFRPRSLLGIYQYTTASGVSYVRYAFNGVASDIDERFQRDDDILDTCWMSYAQLKKAANLRSPLVLACVEDHIEQKAFDLSLFSTY